MFLTKKVPKHKILSPEMKSFQETFDLQYVDLQYLYGLQPGTLFLPVPNSSITSQSGEEIISKNFNSLDAFGEHVIMFLNLEYQTTYFVGIYRNKTYKMFTVDLDSEIILNGFNNEQIIL